MLAPVFHVNPLATIVRERTLPIAGRVNVNVGQKVSPTDVVAEGNYAREHVLLDIARTMGVSANAADKLIKVKDGDRVQQGGLVAQGRGLFSRSIKAPRAGKVMLAGGGQVLMEVGDTRLELKAGMPGIVTRIIPERGVVIRTVGALIQGAWGNGRIDSGVMTSMIEKPDDVLTADRLDISLRGFVILAGYINDVETLRAAAEMPTRGLIVSSMNPSLIQPAMQMRYPILVLEGFGRMPMNSAAFKLFTSNTKRDVTVNAEIFDRFGANRPEAIISLPVTNEPDEPAAYVEFAVGQQIRMRRSPHMGMLGSITNLPARASLLASGLRAPAAEVKLENGTNLLVPLVNLEVVG